MRGRRTLAGRLCIGWVRFSDDVECEIRRGILRCLRARVSGERGGWCEGFGGCGGGGARRRGGRWRVDERWRRGFGWRGLGLGAGSLVHCSEAIYGRGEVG